MFDKVAIVGVGLLGGSLARELRAQDLCQTIIGVCRSDLTANTALSENIVDTVLPLSEAVREAELIVFATPMQSMVPLLKEVASNIPTGSIITDVGSVKTHLYSQLCEQCPQVLSQFVLAHPIAGGENSGVGAAQLNLFSGKNVIITDTQEVSAEATDKVKSMWLSVGANVINMSLQEHDAIFAKTSHLPHVVAFSLVNFLSAQPDNERLFRLAAAGFYDFTRIASSDAEMWRDICVTNKEEVLKALDGFRDQIDEIRLNVDEGDQQAILDYFGAAKAARNAGLHKKKKP